MAIDQSYALAAVEERTAPAHFLPRAQHTRLERLLQGRAWTAMRVGLDTVLMVTPTTDPRRMPAIAARARGFLYVVARLGVTGRGTADPGLASLFDRCRAHSPLPRCIGFGMGSSSDFAPLRGRAEGVIVGSELLGALLAETRPASREDSTRSFVRVMKARLPELWDEGDGGGRNDEGSRD